jgi:hypothetical protein
MEFDLPVPSNYVLLYQLGMSLGLCDCLLDMCTAHTLDICAEMRNVYAICVPVNFFGVFMLFCSQPNFLIMCMLYEFTVVF